MVQVSVQVPALGEAPCGIRNLELRDGALGAPLAALTPDALENARTALIDSLSRIVLYTVNTPLSDTETWKAIFRNASFLRISHIKLCLRTLDGGKNLAALAEPLRMAAAYGIRLVFEPGGKHAFFDEAMYASIRTEQTGIVFNPYHYVCEERNPFLTVLYRSKWKDEIAFLRVVDGLYGSHEPCPIELGNAEIKECASILLARSFGGYFSFTPYLESPISDTVDRFRAMLKTL